MDASKKLQRGKRRFGPVATALRLSRSVATAVVQLDLDNLPASTAVAADSRKVIVRRRNVPVAEFYGRSRGPARHGRLPGRRMSAKPGARRRSP
jgi:hypothetical protein